MVIAECRSLRRIGSILLTALMLCFAGSVQPASAQVLFESLFGASTGMRRSRPPQTNAFAEPFGMFGEGARPSADSGFGHGMVYCVRTCDGRYFPLQRHAGATRQNCANRSVRRPRPWCSPAARSTPRSRQTVHAMPISTTHSPIVTRSATIAPATARMGSGSPASTPPAIRHCGPAISSPPTPA